MGGVAVDVDTVAVNVLAAKLSQSLPPLSLPPSRCELSQEAHRGRWQI